MSSKCNGNESMRHQANNEKILEPKSQNKWTPHRFLLLFLFSVELHLRLYFCCCDVNYHRFHLKLDRIVTSDRWQPGYDERDTDCHVNTVWLRCEEACQNQRCDAGKILLNVWIAGKYSYFHLKQSCAGMHQVKISYSVLEEVVVRSFSHRITLHTCFILHFFVLFACCNFVVIHNLYGANEKK